MQDPSVQGPYPDVLVAAISSAIETAGPTRPLVHEGSPEGRSMGLRTDSVIALDNLATGTVARILRQLGRVPVMGAVDDVLRALLGLH